MIKNKTDIIRKVFIISGSCLLAAATIFLLAWQWNTYAFEKKANAYVDVIRELISEPQGAIPEERRDNTMATLSVEGTDFVGLLELPRYGSVLPVCDDWGDPSKCPCRFSGSVYDRTIQISVGDDVFFIDMEGNRFSYTVTDICYEKNADQSTLQRKAASLTLFIKNVYAFEYIIVYCNVVR